ncbi:hypothetical protein [[Mycoplasma] testudinis]|uniref:hypothetical protein n=1 Tax=[Mycoplasma] testudinis TaxID=33924 RepID=UPI0004880709|nr:hypothetical protein [[Mycoplasma] testudinis]
MKLSLKQRITIVAMKTSGKSVKNVAKKLKISVTRVNDFLNMWNYHGNNAFDCTDIKTYCTPKFKLQIIKQVLKGKSVW